MIRQGRAEGRGWTVGMAGRGSGSINSKLDKLRSVGEQEMYAMHLLGNAFEDLRVQTRKVRLRNNNGVTPAGTGSRYLYR